MNGNLLDRFYRGECTPEEVRAVLQSFRKAAPAADQEQELQRLWQEAGQQQHEPRYAYNAQKSWNNIRAAIEPDTTLEAEDDDRATTAPAEEARVYSLRQWFRAHQYQVAAAILLPLCLLGVLLYFTRNSGQPGQQFVTVEAPLGIRKIVALTDGSLITLNSGSKVTYPVAFTGNKREIQLEGEAFFEVAKDSLRPFIVESGALKTQALGTSFNIRYRAEDATIAVALATGSVKVDREEQQGQNTLATLVPGQQLVYSKAGRQYKVEEFDLREVIAWKEGTLYFRKATMQQVFRQLEYWYGVEVVVTGTVPPENTDWNYTGEYKLESLDSVLEGLGFIKHFTFRKEENKIIIRFENS